MSRATVVQAGLQGLDGDTAVQTGTPGSRRGYHGPDRDAAVQRGTPRSRRGRGHDERTPVGGAAAWLRRRAQALSHGCCGAGARGGDVSAESRRVRRSGLGAGLGPRARGGEPGERRVQGPWAGDEVGEAGRSREAQGRARRSPHGEAPGLTHGPVSLDPAQRQRCLHHVPGPSLGAWRVQSLDS